MSIFRGIFLQKIPMNLFGIPEFSAGVFLTKKQHPGKIKKILKDFQKKIPGGITEKKNFCFNSWQKIGNDC